MEEKGAVAVDIGHLQLAVDVEKFVSSSAVSGKGHSLFNFFQAFYPFPANNLCQVKYFFCFLAPIIQLLLCHRKTCPYFGLQFSLK
jgi:hypothetical protein